MATKVVFDRFRILRYLRQDHVGYTAVATDLLSSEPEVVVKTLRRDSFSVGRTSVMSYFSWLQTQTHRNLGRIVTAGFGPGHDLFWVRPHYVGQADEYPSRDEAIRLIGDLVSAVSYLRRRERMHRRIRPENVFSVDGAFVLVDGSPSPIVRESTIQDIHYLSPEVLRGEEGAIANDLYSLGATLCRLLSGRHVFEDASARTLRAKYLFAAAPKFEADLPDNIARMLEGLTAKDPPSRISAFDELERLVDARNRRSGIASFVGRTVELSAIQVQVCAESQPLSVISIHAACGLGKTALLEEIARRYPFYPVPADFVYFACAPDRSLAELLRTPLRVLIEKHCYRRRIDLASLFGPYRASLEGFFFDTDSESNSALTDRRLFDIVGLLGRISGARRLLIAVDDVHRASTEITTFLRHLGMRASEVCGHLLLTSDNFNGFAERLINDCAIPRFRMIGLLPLDDSAAEEMFSELKGKPKPDEVLAAAGNPFLIEMEGTARGLLTNKDNFGRWLRESIFPLTTEARTLIQALALLEISVPISTLLEFLGFTDSQFQSAIIECKAARIANVKETVALEHSKLVSRHIYLSIPADGRREMHERAFYLLNTFAPDTVIANHAIKAEMHREAANTCLRVAMTASGKAKYAEAIEYYCEASKAFLAVGESMSPMDEAAIANCYSRLGLDGMAQSILARLLKSPKLETNKALRGQVYLRFARFHNADDVERLRLHVASLKCFPDASIEALRILIQISKMLSQLGRLKGSRLLLNRIDQTDQGIFTQRDHHDLIVANGIYQMNSGNFHGAIAYFGTIVTHCDGRPEDAVTPLLILSIGNAATGHEYLGAFSTALGCLNRIVDYAQSSGNAHDQVLSRNNIGAILMKLGEYSAAGRTFDEAEVIYERCRVNDRTFSLSNAAIFTSDRGRFRWEVGQYSTAILLIERLNIGSVVGALDSISIGLTLSEVWLGIGQRERAKTLVEGLRKHALAEIQYFRAEIDLIDMSVTEFDGKRIFLEPLRRQGQAAKSIHQKCRIHCELAAFHVSASQPDEARPYIQDTLRIAKENGYRPIEARAMLLMGRVSAPEEKEQWYQRAFSAGLEMGTPELVAESAYYIGALKIETGNLQAAREYLLKSTVTTAQLADQIPSRYREKYFEEPWRRLARERLHECANSMEFASAQHGEAPTEQGDRLFQALYRVNVAGAAASTVDGFIPRLIQAIEEIPGRWAAILVSRGDRTQWHAVRCDLSDELKKCVKAASDAAKGQSHFEYQDLRLTRGAIVWIPFQSQYESGGLYVSCDPTAVPLGEREMEFLTMLGALTSGVFDRIGARAPEPPQPSAVRDVMTYGLVGTSRAMQEVVSRIELAAFSTATTLIEGETGTGKELVAKAIHTAGPRAAGPFIAVDCGAIPEGLIESELFGAVRGAYTGALADRTGLFEAANQGTIFLDEISNTPTSLQAKLLRVLQEREVRRVGDNKVRAVDVRLIAATNQNLNALADAGAFRRDLLYRLNVLQVELPPLRDRRADIPLLADHFLDLLNVRHKARKHFAAEALAPLAAHRFPGNVRELQNLVERAFFAAPGNRIAAVVPEAGLTPPAADDLSEVDVWFHDLTEGRKDFWTAVHDRYKRRDISREYLVALVDMGLRRTRGNYKELASLFRLDHRSDYRRLMDFLRRNDCLLDFRPYRKAVEPEV